MLFSQYKPYFSHVKKMKNFLRSIIFPEIQELHHEKLVQPHC